MTRILVAASILTAFGIASCTEEDPPETQPNPSACEDSELDYEPMETGLTKASAGEVFQVRVASTTPSPPAEGKGNSMRVQLLDMDGAPLPDATLTKVVPFMPDHGHGTEEVPEPGATDAEGYVDITNIDYRMPGVWRLELHVDAGGTLDTARFFLCIDG